MEELVNRLPEDRSLVGETSRAIEVNAQSEHRILGGLPRPAHDELFRIRVQVLLVKGRGIDRFEQLAQLRHAKLDDLTTGRDRIAGGSTIAHGLTDLLDF